MSGTDACSEHKSLELIRALIAHMKKELMRAFTSVADAFTQRAHQNLIK